MVGRAEEGKRGSSEAHMPKEPLSVHEIKLVVDFFNGLRPFSSLWVSEVMYY